MHKTMALREESNILRGNQLTQDVSLGQFQSWCELDPKDV